LETLLGADTVDKIKTLLTASVDYGTAKNARIPFRTIYGKTGTSQDHRDAWFIGATTNLVVGIWVGNDDNTPMKSRVSGGTLPTIIWHDYIENLDNIPQTELSNESTPWQSKGLFDIIFGSGKEKPMEAD
jgi:membrane peptidoglycan carboxypeptidase